MTARWIQMLGHHLSNCRQIDQTLRHSDPTDLRDLYWYDLPLRRAVSARGFLKVLFWTLHQRHPVDEAAQNHGVQMLYYPLPEKSSPSDSNPTVWNYRGLSIGPWFDGPLDAVRVLERAAHTIASEYELVREFLTCHPDGKRLALRGEWRALFLFDVHGSRNHLLEPYCPVTMKVVESLPLCKPFGFVMFSELKAGTNIAPHTGSSNLRLRVHLGVSVPESSRATIRVGREVRHWTELKCLSLDDSFEHEAVNRGTKSRVVLSVDIWHPRLRPSEIEILERPVFRRFGKLRDTSSD